MKWCVSRFSPISEFASTCFLALRTSNTQTFTNFLIWSIYGTGNCIIAWCGSMDPEMWEKTIAGGKKFCLHQKLSDLCRWINTRTFLHLCTAWPTPPGAVWVCWIRHRFTPPFLPVREVPASRRDWCCKGSLELCVLKLLLRGRLEVHSPVWGRHWVPLQGGHPENTEPSHCGLVGMGAL